MKSVISYDNFLFLNIKFKNYHHTDNRAGCPYHYLAKLLKGTAKIVSENKTLEIKAGDVFYIPKNLPYQSYWYGNENGDVDFLSFGFDELETKELLKYELQVIPVTPGTSAKIDNIPTNGNHITCKSLSIFYDALADILPVLKIGYEDKEEMLVKKIKQCIHMHPHASLGEIAGMCAVSEPYLYLLFRKNTRYTPNFYRQQVLCKLGVELLITTDNKIEDISASLNFSSASYFRKILKLHTGKTPREIRKERSLRTM